MTIEEIADDCLSKLDEESKQLVKKEYKSAEEFATAQHFLYGMQVRNDYIHGKDIQSGMHPDDLSNEILKQIYKKLTMSTLKLKEGEHNSPFTNLDGSIDIAAKQMTVGFTGTRSGMSDAQKERVKTLLIDLNPDKALHGMCIGADEDFHNICKELGIYIEGYPGKSAMGDNVTYRSLCEPDITHEEDTHFSRNRKIVDMCNVLIACPYNEDNKGGTWYTINYADKQHKNLIIVHRDNGRTTSII